MYNIPSRSYFSRILEEFRRETRSNHLGDGYGRLAAYLDDICQCLVKRRLLSAVIDARVMVLLLLIAKPLDRLEDFLVHFLAALHQYAQLIVVMFNDHGLHGYGTRHRRSLAHQSGAGAKSEPGDVPQWGESGGPDTVLSNQLLELGAVLLFLIPHVLYGRSDRGLTYDYTIVELNNYAIYG